MGSITDGLAFRRVSASRSREQRLKGGRKIVVGITAVSRFLVILGLRAGCFAS